MYKENSKIQGYTTAKLNKTCKGKLKANYLTNACLSSLYSLSFLMTGIYQARVKNIRNCDLMHCTHETSAGDAFLHMHLSHIWDDGAQVAEWIALKS